MFTVGPYLVGDTFPMLGDLEESFESVSVHMSAGQISKYVLKVYPHLVHFIKAKGVEVDLPTTIHRYKSRLGVIQDILQQLWQVDLNQYCGF